MKCNSCTAEVPPEWVNAIKKNECPGCGEAILTTDVKSLMDELAAAMELMPNNPQGVAGWLVDNYHFKKIGAAQPVEKFHTKQSKKAAVQDDDEYVNEFLERSGHARKVKETQNKIKNNQISTLANQINGIEDENDIEIGGDDEEFNPSGPMTPEERLFLAQHQNKAANKRIMGPQRFQQNESFIDPNVGEVSQEDFENISQFDFREPHETDEQILNNNRMNRLRKQNSRPSFKTTK